MAAIPEKLSLFKRTGTSYALYYVGSRRRWKSSAVGTRPEAAKKVYEHTLARFKALAGDVALPELTAEAFDQYKAKWLASVSPVSVNIELRALRAALATARRWGLLDLALS